MNTFVEDLSHCFVDLSHDKKTYYILGDLNINTSSSNRSLSAEHFVNSILSCGAFPITTKPTRVTATSATIIDHVITNDTNHSILPGVIETSCLSDHNVLFCQIANLPSNVKKRDKYPRMYRDKSKFNSESYANDLDVALNEYFTHLSPLNNQNYNEIFNNFTLTVSSIINKHAVVICILFGNSVG